ncbi:MAG: alpha/beta hydrolase fold protein [Planctomycetota bacterium]|nr:MAG: alpha/beta hydrolase fold protein [Planctomycetota bacterium]
MIPCSSFLQISDESTTNNMLKRIDIPGATLSVLEQVAELSRDFRCVVPDLRGFGQSTVTEGTVTMEQFADDLAKLLDALAITEPVVLCGLSMGGYIAWQFARRHADQLRGLILCDTRAVPDSAEAAANRRKLAEDVVRTGPELVANAMLPKLFSDRATDRRTELNDELRRVILATDPRGIAAASRGMAERADAHAWLPAIDYPALLLVGEQDVISTPAEMSEITAAMPKATFRMIADAGHLAPLENPGPTNEAIRNFLATL